MQDHEPQDDSSDAAPNPFEPSTLDWSDHRQGLGPKGSNRERVKFWVLSLACFGTAVGLSFVLPPIGIFCVAVTIAAPIRVFLLKRAQSAEFRARSEDSPPMLVRLGASLLLVFAMGFASCIAFVMICLPTGFITFSLLGQSIYEDWLVVIVFGVSSLLAFIVFLWLFRLSLRLRY